jgi:hypothetical protein
VAELGDMKLIAKLKPQRMILVRQTDQQHCQANDGLQEGHPWPAIPSKAVSKDTVPMMDVSKDTTNQAISKIIVKLTNYKEETIAGNKPESANEEPRPSLLCIGFNNNIYRCDDVWHLRMAFQHFIYVKLSDQIFFQTI